jgi:hypothetical protein
MDGFKRCGPCGETKPLNEFYRKGDGYRSACKECEKASARKWAKDNPEKNNARTKKRAKDHPEAIRKQNKVHYQKNAETIKARANKYYYDNIDAVKEKTKKYREDNPEVIRQRKKDWHEKNAEDINAKAKERYREDPDKFKKAVSERRNRDLDKAHEKEKIRYDKRKDDPEFRIPRLLRTRLNHALDGKIKVASAVLDLGCSISEFKVYLERKFYVNPKTNQMMTWDDRGRYGWHLDHIVPLSYFDLKDREQAKIACHYTNIQPLWAEDNLKKGNKVPTNVDDLIASISQEIKKTAPIADKNT